MEFGDEIWWKITLKIHNRADVISFVRSYEKLHSKIPLISITLLIKQISPGVWTVFGCFHLGARSYIVIGSHITGLNPVWDSRWLDILCKFYFHRFGDFFCWSLYANESFWKYICDFVDLLVLYIIIQEEEPCEKMCFSKSRDSLGGGFRYFLFSPYLGKIPILTNIFQRGWNHQLVQNYFPQLHWLLAQWSCGFLPIATLTDLLCVASDGWNIWDKNHAPQSPHWDQSIFCRIFEGCVLTSVRFFYFLRFWAPGSPYI